MLIKSHPKNQKMSQNTNPEIQPPIEPEVPTEEEEFSQRRSTPLEAASQPPYFNSNNPSNFSSGFSEEVVFDCLQSIQTFRGANPAEIRLNLFPMPYRVESHNNGIPDFSCTNRHQIDLMGSFRAPINLQSYIQPQQNLSNSTSRGLSPATSFRSFNSQNALKTSLPPGIGETPRLGGAYVSSNAAISEKSDSNSFNLEVEQITNFINNKDLDVDSTNSYTGGEDSRGTGSEYNSRNLETGHQMASFGKEPGLRNSRSQKGSASKKSESWGQANPSGDSYGNILNSGYVGGGTNYESFNELERITERSKESGVEYLNHSLDPDCPIFANSKGEQSVQDIVNFDEIPRSQRRSSNEYNTDGGELEASGAYSKKFGSEQMELFESKNSTKKRQKQIFSHEQEALEMEADINQTFRDYINSGSRKLTEGKRSAKTVQNQDGGSSVYSSRYIDHDLAAEELERILRSNSEELSREHFSGPGEEKENFRMNGNGLQMTDNSRNGHFLSKSSIEELNFAKIRNPNLRVNRYNQEFTELNRDDMMPNEANFHRKNDFFGQPQQNPKNGPKHTFRGPHLHQHSEKDSELGVDQFRSSGNGFQNSRILDKKKFSGSFNNTASTHLESYIREQSLLLDPKSSKQQKVSTKTKSGFSKKRSSLQRSEIRMESVSEFNPDGSQSQPSLVDIDHREPENQENSRSRIPKPEAYDSVLNTFGTQNQHPRRQKRPQKPLNPKKTSLRRKKSRKSYGRLKADLNSSSSVISSQRSRIDSGVSSQRSGAGFGGGSNFTSRTTGSESISVRTHLTEASSISNNDSYMTTKKKLLKKIREENKILLNSINDVEGKVNTLKKALRGKRRRIKNSKQDLKKKQALYAELAKTIDRLQNNNDKMVDQLSTTLESVPLTSKRSRLSKQNLEQARELISNSKSNFDFSQENKENNRSVHNMDIRTLNSLCLGSLDRPNQIIRHGSLDQAVYNASKLEFNLDKAPEGQELTLRPHLEASRRTKSYSLTNNPKGHQSAHFGVKALSQGIDYESLRSGSSAGDQQSVQQQFPVLKDKLNKSLMEFFLQGDTMEDSQYDDEQ